MRALALLTLTAGTLATASLPASADQLVENFTITVSGAVNTNFLSTPFDLFDPSLGTLTSVGETVTGSPTWGAPTKSEQLLLSLAKTGASEFFSASSAGLQVIGVDLTGAAGFNAPLFVGLGTTQESLLASESPGVGILSGELTGTVTYNFTPASVSTQTVPEPSTWAMTLIGFATVGYAAMRRKGARRSVSA